MRYSNNSAAACDTLTVGAMFNGEIDDGKLEVDDSVATSSDTDEDTQDGGFGKLLIDEEQTLETRLEKSPTEADIPVDPYNSKDSNASLFASPRTPPSSRLKTDTPSGKRKNSSLSNSADNETLRLKIKRLKMPTRNGSKHAIVQHLQNRAAAAADSTLTNGHASTPSPQTVLIPSVDPTLADSGPCTSDGSLEKLSENTGISVEKLHGTGMHSDRGTCVRSVATSLECEQLGPCPSGTAISLNGVLWLECTKAGMLVVNATWRGRSYVGTLMDVSKTNDALQPARLFEYTRNVRSRPASRMKRFNGSKALKRNSLVASQSCTDVSKLAVDSAEALPTPVEGLDDSTVSPDKVDGTPPPLVLNVDYQHLTDAQPQVPCSVRHCGMRFYSDEARRYHENQPNAHTGPLYKPATRDASTSVDQNLELPPAQRESLEKLFGVVGRQQPGVSQPAAPSAAEVKNELKSPNMYEDISDNEEDSTPLPPPPQTSSQTVRPTQTVHIPVGHASSMPVSGPPTHRPQTQPSTLKLALSGESKPCAPVKPSPPGPPQPSQPSPAGASVPLPTPPQQAQQPSPHLSMQQQHQQMELAAFMAAQHGLMPQGYGIPMHPHHQLAALQALQMQAQQQQSAQLRPAMSVTPGPYGGYNMSMMSTGGNLQLPVQPAVPSGFHSPLARSGVSSPVARPSPHKIHELGSGVKQAAAAMNGK